MNKKEISVEKERELFKKPLSVSAAIVSLAMVEFINRCSFRSPSRYSLLYIPADELTVEEGAAT